MITLPPPPAFLVRLGQHLPPPLLSVPFAAALEISRLLKWLVPPEELNTRRFALHIEDFGLRFCFQCQNQRFLPVWSASADLELSACHTDFLALLRGTVDPDTLFFQRRLKITGDTELGLIVKNWLDTAERPQWLSSPNYPV